MQEKEGKFNARRKPVVFIILDGWGLGPANHGNAIAAARTPVFDALYKKYPNTSLKCSGSSVGLPRGQEGNSEAGHLNIGAGRVVKQDMVYISESIKDGTFFKNTAFLEAVKHIKKYEKRLHLMGMLSNGASGHASPEHLYALLEFARRQKISRVFLHLFTDGRDSPRFEALKLLDRLERHMNGSERIASICGRFYAMDRNKIWGRTELAYNAVACGKGVIAEDARSAVIQAYNRGMSDEFILPTLMRNGDGSLTPRIFNNDAVIFFNLRSDRARQLTKPFVQPDFEKENSGAFKRACVPKNTAFVTLTDLGPDLPGVFTAFPSRDIKNGLVEVIGSHGYRQLHIAESEKFAHITYFLNGGYAAPVAGEDRIRIPSPFVPRYDSVPEMSTYKITNTAIDAIRNKGYDFVAINFAAPDMIAHTGNFQAGIKTAEVIDECVGKIVRTVFEKGGLVIITSDHGNLDEMIDAKTGAIETKHSMNNVPFILADNKEFKNVRLKNGGALENIAPTILKIINLPIPKEMAAKPLF
ncbi:MAG: 2,3-bisphosphoglycerate-independent phosphoglycerate mutase [Patescibacteria group bacterium]|nr:2,3-bisphosphoglycerate-independent phosphoglycerate mutase [Patescibacteria group bacterium]